MKLVELAREAVINSPKTICEQITRMIMEEAESGGTNTYYKLLVDYDKQKIICDYFKNEGFQVSLSGDFIEISWMQ